MDTLLSVGRICYAIAVIAFGILHLAHGDFVTRVVPWWPAWLPPQALWAYGVGVILIAAGTALMMNRQTVLVANLLGSALLLSFVALGLPMAAADSVLGGGWTRAGKALALSGGAFLVAQSSFGIGAGPMPNPAAFNQRLARLWPLGTWFFASFLLLCGVQHFVLVDFVQSLVPTWIPGAQVWTYVAGVALIAGGIGLLVPPTARLAALLSGLMIFIWVVILHIPRAISAFPRSTNETTAVFEALAMSGIAWLIAAMTVVRPRAPRSVVQQSQLAAAIERRAV
jgi:uncharacterized membrane protein